MSWSDALRYLTMDNPLSQAVIISTKAVLQGAVSASILVLLYRSGVESPFSLGKGTMVMHMSHLTLLLISFHF